VRARARTVSGLSARDRSLGGEHAWFEGEDGPLSWIDALARALGRTWGVARGVDVEIDGDLPLEPVPDSLAARGVATARAWLRALGRELPAEEVAMLVTGALHDAAAPHLGLEALGAAFGGPLHARASGGQLRAEPIEARLPLTVARLPGASAGASRQTIADLWAGSGARLRDVAAVQRTSAVRTALETQSVLARVARRAAAAQDLPVLGELLDRAQRLHEEELCAIVPGLSEAGTYRVVRALRRAGALGARALPTLPGGVVALWRDEEEARAGAARLDAMGLRVG
jgi:hypothetical protein